MTSGRHSRAKNASFSVCPENPDLTFASKIFSVVFDGHFETISEQRKVVSNLRLPRTFLRVETVSGQALLPRPFFLFALVQSFMTGFFVSASFVAE